MPPNQLNLGTLQMPLAAATKTFAILAKRGAGKSYTGAVLAEEFAANEIPFVVFDPIDVWWGLRLAADGVSAGLPVVVFGIEHADVPLTADMGVEIARAVVERNVSVVISTFGMSKTAQRKLITDFSEELLRINNRPRHIIVEEAHEFVPQRVMGDMARCFNAVNSLVVMGRNRGLGATLISQRAATINKDTLTQIDTLLAFRNVAPQDRKALREWVEYHAAEGDFAAFMDSLPNLPTGEGWAWSPEFLETFERVKIRTRRTFHPDREKLGASFAIPPLAQADVQEFIDHFQSEKSTMVEKKVKPMPKPASTQLAIPRPEPSQATLVADLQAQVQRLADELRQREEEIAQKDRRIDELEGKLRQIAAIVGVATIAQPAPSPLNPPDVDRAILERWIDKVGRNTGAGRILSYLAQKVGMTFTRNQLAVAVGMTASGGSYLSYLSTLKRTGLIVEEKGRIKVSPNLQG